jgi:hypothetical protein
MADAGEDFEVIGCCDQILCALGGRPPDGIVGVAPDLECGRADRAARDTR